MNSSDRLYRFTFENLGIRGELVKLSASWQAMIEHHDYPAVVRDRLGQATAAVALLGATVKLDGSLILQVQGEGPVHMLVAQTDDRSHVRGLARFGGEVSDGALADVFGPGRIVMTIDPAKGERYQGIVALEGEHLSEALEAYFGQSEQLRTRFWLFGNADHCAGLMIQELPDESENDEDWERVVALAGTVTEKEIVNLGAEELLRRLFHEEQVRLFEPNLMSFACSCSQDKIASTLLSLGRVDVNELVAEQGEIELTCEFCNRQYRFDSVDVEALFAPAHIHDGPATAQ